MVGISDLRGSGSSGWGPMPCRTASRAVSAQPAPPSIHALNPTASSNDLRMSHLHQASLPSGVAVASVGDLA
jgi:hypothetical protein